MKSIFFVRSADNLPFILVTSSETGTEFQPLMHDAEDIARVLSEAYDKDSINIRQLTGALNDKLDIDGPHPINEETEQRIASFLEEANIPAYLPSTQPPRFTGKSDVLYEIEVTDVPLDMFDDAAAFKNIVEYKAMAFISDQTKTTFNYEVKRVRAIWDPSLSIPGTDRRGGWRCPVGTRYGGQITDRFGRNCGWGIARRIANAITNIGERLEGADDKRRGRRAERIARRVGNAAPSARGTGRVERGLRGIAERLEGGGGGTAETLTPNVLSAPQERVPGRIERGLRRIGNILDPSDEEIAARRWAAALAYQQPEQGEGGALERMFRNREMWGDIGEVFANALQRRRERREQAVETRVRGAGIPAANAPDGRGRGRRPRAEAEPPQQLNAQEIEQLRALGLAPNEGETFDAFLDRQYQNYKDQIDAANAAGNMNPRRALGREAWERRNKDELRNLFDEVNGNEPFNPPARPAEGGGGGTARPDVIDSVTVPAGVGRQDNLRIPEPQKRRIANAPAGAPANPRQGDIFVGADGRRWVFVESVGGTSRWQEESPRPGGPASRIIDNAAGRGGGRRRPWGVEGIEPEFLPERDGVSDIENFENGVAIFKQNGKWGFLIPSRNRRGDIEWFERRDFNDRDSAARELNRRLGETVAQIGGREPAARPRRRPGDLIQVEGDGGAIPLPQVGGDDNAIDLIRDGDVSRIVKDFADAGVPIDELDLPQVMGDEQRNGRLRELYRPLYDRNGRLNNLGRRVLEERAAQGGAIQPDAGTRRPAVRPEVRRPLGGRGREQQRPRGSDRRQEQVDDVMPNETFDQYVDRKYAEYEALIEDQRARGDRPGKLTRSEWLAFNRGNLREAYDQRQGRQAAREVPAGEAAPAPRPARPRQPRNPRNRRAEGSDGLARDTAARRPPREEDVAVGATPAPARRVTRVSPAGAPEAETPPPVESAPDVRSFRNIRNKFGSDGLPDEAYWRAPDYDGDDKDELERRFGRYYSKRTNRINARGREARDEVRGGAGRPQGGQAGRGRGRGGRGGQRNAGGNNQQPAGALDKFIRGNPDAFGRNFSEFRQGGLEEAIMYRRGSDDSLARRFRNQHGDINDPDARTPDLASIDRDLRAAEPELKRRQKESQDLRAEIDKFLLDNGINDGNIENLTPLQKDQLAGLITEYTETEALARFYKAKIDYLNAQRAAIVDRNAGAGQAAPARRLARTGEDVWENPFSERAKGILRQAGIDLDEGIAARVRDGDDEFDAWKENMDALDTRDLSQRLDEAEQLLRFRDGQEQDAGLPIIGRLMVIRDRAGSNGELTAADKSAVKILGENYMERAAERMEALRRAKHLRDLVANRGGGSTPTPPRPSTARPAVGAVADIGALQREIENAAPERLAKLLDEVNKDADNELRKMQELFDEIGDVFARLPLDPNVRTADLSPEDAEVVRRYREAYSKLDAANQRRRVVQEAIDRRFPDGLPGRGQAAATPAAPRPAARPRRARAPRREPIQPRVDTAVRIAPFTPSEQADIQRFGGPDIDAALRAREANLPRYLDDYENEIRRGRSLPEIEDAIANIEDSIVAMQRDEERLKNEVKAIMERMNSIENRLGPNGQMSDADKRKIAEYIDARSLREFNEKMRDRAVQIRNEKRAGGGRAPAAPAPAGAAQAQRGGPTPLAERLKRTPQQKLDAANARVPGAILKNKNGRFDQAMAHVDYDGIQIPMHVPKGNNGINTQAAADRALAEGASLDDIPDEFLRDAILANSYVEGQPSQGKRFSIKGGMKGINNRGAEDEASKTHLVTDTVTGRKYILKTPSFQKDEFVGEEIGAFIGQMLGRPMARVRIAGLRKPRLNQERPRNGPKENAPILVEHFDDIIDINGPLLMWAEAMGKPQYTRAPKDEVAEQVMRVIDRVLGNPDRHEENYMVHIRPDGKREYVPIDHGIFGEAGRYQRVKEITETQARTVLTPFIASPAGKQALASLSDLTDEQIDAMGASINGLAVGMGMGAADLRKLGNDMDTLRQNMVRLRAAARRLLNRNP